MFNRVLNMLLGWYQSPNKISVTLNERPKYIFVLLFNKHFQVYHQNGVYQKLGHQGNHYNSRMYEGQIYILGLGTRIQCIRKMTNHLASQWTRKKNNLKRVNIRKTNSHKTRFSSKDSEESNVFSAILVTLANYIKYSHCQNR